MRQDLTYKRDDGEFHYIDWGGSGPLLHLAHANGFSAGVYSPLAERLAAHLRVVGMDDRGHGGTTVPADPEKIDNWNIFVDDLVHFFEFLGEPVIAVGHSRGAVVSLLAAVRRPDLIRALILIDPTILPFSRMGPWFVMKKTGLSGMVPIVAKARKRRRIWPDRDTILMSYGKKEPFRTWQSEFLKAYIADGTRETDRGEVELCCEPAFESSCFAACPHDIWRYIPRLKQPVMVLYGAQSRTFLRPAVKRFMAKLPGAVFKGFEETSHFVPMERPDESAQAIIAFSKEL
ncbi:MAG: alpha/beta hydrolase [Proteobacteria bacterium]|nr:alpha/beta hydrolase [Pseudomonadota bacterium]